MADTTNQIDAISRLGEDTIRERYGNLFDMYERITGENPYEVPMRIYPASHYTMGGLWVDYNLETTIPGLFASGEANFSDHGANRLGASALMQGLADGYFVLPYTIGHYFASEKPEPVGIDDPAFDAVEKEAQERIDKLNTLYLRLESGDDDGSDAEPRVIDRELTVYRKREIHIRRDHFLKAFRGFFHHLADGQGHFIEKRRYGLADQGENAGMGLVGVHHGVYIQPVAVNRDVHAGFHGRREFALDNFQIEIDDLGHERFDVPVPLENRADRRRGRRRRPTPPR